MPVIEQQSSLFDVNVSRADFPDFVSGHFLWQTIFLWSSFSDIFVRTSLSQGISVASLLLMHLPVMEDNVAKIS